MSQNPHIIAQRVAALCQRLTEAQVDAYLVPSVDTHLNEYAPAYQHRRAAITGFTGSAGDALICPAGSHLFVDSRYHLQAEREVDPALFRVHKLGVTGEHTLSEWLTEMEREQGRLRVGFDPFVLPMEAHATYAKALRASGSALVPLAPNLVDAVWEDQPPVPTRPIYALPDELTGRSVAEKLAAVREQMERVDAAVLILTKLDEIAWLTNLRGSDVAHNPVFEAYLVLEQQRATCLTRVTPSQEIQDALASYINFAPYETYGEVVRSVAAIPEVRVWLDPAGTTMGTRLLLAEEQQIHAERDPLVLMKALKNPQEIASSREAHRRAAAAKIRSMAWVDRMVAAEQPVSERAFVEKLSAEYAREDGFCDLSFPTISAAGANGAIVHYSGANPEIALRDGELFLIDSGTQMLGGTTDDTRTISIGTPSERQRQLYTAVLRGHVQLARQKFPEGTNGVALDAVARSVMWNLGLDYGHGTGHGVGAFLNVHEGPQRIATRSSDEPLQVGMIVSNEPGYYEAGWGGIRLENLYVVSLADEPLPPHPNGKQWLQLEPLTMIPFDHRLIDWPQLSDTERAWLAWYHQRVWETVSPVLDEADRAWLRAACEAFF
jgi:Xaa-Pro aminopeptidase